MTLMNAAESRAGAHLGPCIETKAAKNAHGYGCVWIDGKHVREHRLVFAEFNGLELADIKGKVVRHRCDNPSCVNPQHLELGTQADNVRDMMQRGRKNPVRGSAHKCSKLSESDIPTIRHLLASGESQRAIACSFGVTQKVVCRIASGKSWGHVA